MVVVAAVVLASGKGWAGLGTFGGWFGKMPFHGSAPETSPGAKLPLEGFRELKLEGAVSQTIPIAP